MPEYLSPGVYVEEVSGGEKPIEGVGTSVGGFVGLSKKGPIGKAQLITNWSQFVTVFGDLNIKYKLGFAVYQFFAEGGTSCYVVRTCKYNESSGAQADPATKTFQDGPTNPENTLTVEAKSPGDWGNNLTVEISAATDKNKDHFNLTVSEKNLGVVELFENLDITDTSDNYVESVINDYSLWIKVTKLTTGGRPADKKESLTGGSYTTDGVTTSDWIGNKDKRTGIYAFDEKDDVNNIAIPDSLGDQNTITQALAYCAGRKDTFFVADTPLGKTPTTAKEFRDGITGLSYGALYWPWVKISNPATGKEELVPPSGAILGIFANTDKTRGVHKAPAGTIDGLLKSVIGIEYQATKGEHDMLNPAGVNVLRTFPGTGNVIWGARTLSSDPEWKYINLRRLFMFCEESIGKGIQWCVFEPNDHSLWAKIKRNISAFLTMVWRSGALFGTTTKEAFYVKCDEELNPPEVRSAGQVIIEVGIAPVKPAEFVIMRISQKTLKS